MWNKLPLSIRHASGISGFKKGVRDYLTLKKCLIQFSCFRFFIRWSARYGDFFSFADHCYGHFFLLLLAILAIINCNKEKSVLIAWTSTQVIMFFLIIIFARMRLV